MKVLAAILFLSLLSCSMAIISIHLGHSHHYVPYYGHGHSYGHGYSHGPYYYYPSYHHAFHHGHHGKALSISFGKR
ncbi:hypothetical protein X975_09439, partial [Stegodyphus mimosarum]